jgi:putative FmdB family regulatory protein
MPMYDFECTQCGHAFETITPSSAPPPPCPECQAPTDRLMGAPMLGQGKAGDMSPKAKKYLSKEFQSKVKAKTEKQGGRWGPPK